MGILKEGKWEIVDKTLFKNWLCFVFKSYFVFKLDHLNFSSINIFDTL